MTEIRQKKIDPLRPRFKVTRDHWLIGTDTGRSANHMLITMGLSRTVSEIKGDFGIENRKLCHPTYI